MKKVAFLAVAGLCLLGLAGCPSSEGGTTPAPPAAPKGPPPAAPGAAQKPSSQMSTDVMAAPAGASTDMSGGLNGPKPK